MKKTTKVSRLKGLFLAALVPFITACNGGGGGGDTALLGSGSLFSGLGGNGGSGSGLLPGGGDEIASLTNPEPASMILLGSGMAALTYFNNKKRIK